MKPARLIVDLFSLAVQTGHVNWDDDASIKKSFSVIPAAREAVRRNIELGWSPHFWVPLDNENQWRTAYELIAEWFGRDVAEASDIDMSTADVWGLVPEARDYWLGRSLCYWLKHWTRIYSIRFVGLDRRDRALARASGATWMDAHAFIQGAPWRLDGQPMPEAVAA